MDHESIECAPQAGLADNADLRWLAGLDTPCYVFDPRIVLARYTALREALGTRLVVSLKANSNADLFVRCGHAFEDGIELASQGELDIVVGRGKQPKYLNNPSMSEDFMRAGLASRCHFIIDNPDMARRFIALAAGKPKQDVMLRMNAGALVGERAPKGWHDHFGMTMTEAVHVTELFKAAGVAISGLHAFAGSGSFRVSDAHGDEADSPDLAFALAHAAEQLAQIAHAPITFLNVGGGFSEKGHGEEVFSRYRERLSPLAARYSIAHESGRAIFADAGVFVTRVTAVKHWPDRIVAVCDGGMSHNFLLARTESVLKAWQQPIVVPCNGMHAAASSDARAVTLVGNTCNRADVIGRLSADRRPPQPGDFVLFEQCGAYNHSYTVSGFLSLRPAKVYIRQA
ncbi:PLP-dependent decarboxylase [Trinickia symbiotica]|uniref:PLP-dependent decarboxylase n=1 Tax=Trinickia symbiotica TaxID=863227 RepID=A0A2N7X9Z6_9BURK|nr:PLP-dependent decarboxylase [Trinickia symbiotica]PMS38410.1 PLP-dependent decarboxylase [Trinickia symbiotica]